ncbi:hypothetical protein [Acetobacterium wieringae]|uniref:hypothetical protein n=1 Tax=Acetobacterium wieringae TaxID=52694 RepID=UPI00203334BB|nr:hypothetical protein [Acetobacterium wieringae]URN83986.1 hypothetical protein CHL1_003154 [Acetobacterium wieringae]URN85164.1 hypothetical protein CHL1_000794 [Acetobacterium wieringae]
MSEKILMRNCQTCKNYKIGIDGVCKDCTLHRAQPNYSNWEWNGIESGCEFCNIQNFNDNAIVESRDLFICAGVKDDKIIIYYADSQNEASFDIGEVHYCPMCGRKLRATE